MLHIVNKSPYSSSSLEQCLRFAVQDDVILLYEDAVYAVLKNSKTQATISAALAKHKIYALSADLKARAIANVVDGVQIATYDDFVDLVAQHKINNWL